MVFHISSKSRFHNTSNYIKICYISLLGNLLVMLNFNPIFVPTWKLGFIGIYTSRELFAFRGLQETAFVFASFKTMILLRRSSVQKW